MKILKYLLGLIVLLALIFFGSGLLTPSVSYESEVVVNKTAAESWAVMSDESKLQHWIQGYIRSELVSGTANTKGAITNVFVDNNGEEMSMKETIKDIVPEELLDMQFSMDFMDMDYTMTMKEADGKTTIHTNSTTKGNGIFAKSMLSLMKGGMKDQEDVNMNNLKDLIENNTTNYFVQDTMTVGVDTIIQAE